MRAIPALGVVIVVVSGVGAQSFLSEQQKRDIFYNNAARFLRLDRPQARQDQ